jgi:hypothetical protein
VKSKRTILVLAGAALWLAACATPTTLENTWRSPSLTGPVHFKKVLAVAMVEDPDLRRRAEDEIVSHLRSDDALPTRAVIPDAELGDVERAKARLAAGGFDGAVVMRPVAVEERVKYSSAYIANDYDSFWGYYGAGWGDPWQAGPMKVDTHLRVETLVYSVTTDELLWVGVTRTINPESLRVTINQIAAAVVEDLRKHGLVPASRQP